MNNNNNNKDTEGKRFIKRFRLSFSAGTSTHERKTSLVNMSPSTSSLNNIDSNYNNNNNVTNTPIKSVTSSPSIHYTPVNDNNQQPQLPSQPNEEFQFTVPTTPSDKKKKRVVFQVN
ncbi:hypothetical protein DDB_G0289983 [Dictyostelium discoideum AX4]|uniref:Uncharacterized protein n=1 Tax=Dictyostelium discoideum TaxID=44689 RepID=Q54GS5_DICDI|nr:hypothetical protein DDB_G0289983 [Dictyostelium discoideum AX4]EAL62504.1 hypothetical protein DDB_G0289983 [Dictyostelium discoideum AX4]|eukprot:XP_635994.1 hypothetical protein DDB_G0289983 [Dictyostelium discoideum AX4]